MQLVVRVSKKIWVLRISGCELNQHSSCHWQGCTGIYFAFSQQETKAPDSTAQIYLRVRAVSRDFSHSRLMVRLSDPLVALLDSAHAPNGIHLSLLQCRMTE